MMMFSFYFDTVFVLFHHRLFQFELLFPIYSENLKFMKVIQVIFNSLNFLTIS